MQLVITMTFNAKQMSRARLLIQAKKTLQLLCKKSCLFNVYYLAECYGETLHSMQSARSTPYWFCSSCASGRSQVKFSRHWNCRKHLILNVILEKLRILSCTRWLLQRNITRAVVSCCMCQVGSIRVVRNNCLGEEGAKYIFRSVMYLKFVNWPYFGGMFCRHYI